VRTIARQVETGAITTLPGLLEAAHRYEVSFRQLHDFIDPDIGLTRAGQKFLDKGWTPGRTARVLNALERSASSTPGQQGATPPSATGAPRKQVTAALLLEICDMGVAGIGTYGGLRRFAKFRQVSYHTLKKCVIARSGTLTEMGLKIVKRAYPGRAVDRSTATITDLPDCCPSHS
jgi:hypothetical protein